VETQIGRLEVQGSGTGSLTVLIRPEAAATTSTEDGTRIEAALVRRSFRGALSHVEVHCASGTRLTFELPAHINLPELGQTVSLVLRREAIVCIEE
jgi:hypothetical protein